MSAGRVEALATQLIGLSTARLSYESCEPDARAQPAKPRTPRCDSNTHLGRSLLLHGSIAYLMEADRFGELASV